MDQAEPFRKKWDEVNRSLKRIAQAEARAKTTQARRAKQAYQKEIRRWSATKLAALAAGRCQKAFLRCALAL